MNDNISKLFKILNILADTMYIKTIANTKLKLIVH